MGFSESTKTTNKGHFACFGGQWLPLVWVKMKLKPFRIWVDKYLFWRRIFNPPHGPPGLFSSSSLFSQKSQIEIYSGKGVLKSEEEKRKWRRRLGGCR